MTISEPSERVVEHICKAVESGSAWDIAAAQAHIEFGVFCTWLNAGRIDNPLPAHKAFVQALLRSTEQRNASLPA